MTRLWYHILLSNTYRRQIEHHNNTTSRPYTQCSDETRYYISHGKYFVEKKIILIGFDLKKIEGSHTIIRQIRLQQSYTRSRRNNIKSTHGSDGYGFWCRHKYDVHTIFTRVKNIIGFVHVPRYTIHGRFSTINLPIS